jgi:response regulator RpfG family c-di-GMP phosphodiesterase
MIAVLSEFSLRRDRPRVLCVDDEAQILESLRDTLHEGFDVHTATSGADGLVQLRREPDAYPLIVSDMRMPAMSGAVFLRESRRVAPDAVRILLTGYADLQAAVSAVNDGQLFRFLTKPCEPEELMRACVAGLSQYRLQTAERVLLEQTLKGSVQALADVLALASPAAFGRSQRVRATVERLALAINLAEPWEVEVSALLVHVGAVTLPPPTAEKLYAGGQLNSSEEAMVKRVPAATRRILSNIPRLEGVLEILSSYQRPFDDDRPDGLPIGARILRIALDYDALDLSPSAGLRALSEVDGVYDPELLDVFASIVGSGASRRAVLEIGVRHLRPGMTLADDVQSTLGSLLIARGQGVNEELIERLANLGHDFVRQPLLVLAVEPEAIANGSVAELGHNTS